MLFEKTWCVYLHTNLINDKKYVGITSQKPNHRWGKDGHNYLGQDKFYRAIQKYGWDHFSHEILETSLTKQEALAMEAKLIDEYDTVKNGYNCSLFGGDIYSKEIYCVETQEKFPSISAAARKYDKSDTTLSHHLHGDKGFRLAYGLHWYFVNDELNNEHYEADYLYELQKSEEEAKEMNLIELYLEGLTVRQISEKTGDSRERISRIIKKYGISFRTNCISAIALDKNTLEPIQEFQTLRSACEWCNIPYTDNSRIKLAILDSWRVCKGYKWTTKNEDLLLKREKREQEYLKNAPPIELMAEDYNNGYTAQDIAIKYGYSRPTVSKMLKEYGMTLANGGKKPIVQVNPNTNEIVKKYLSMKEAYHSLGCNPNNPTLGKRCKDHKIYHDYIWWYEQDYFEHFNLT